MYACFFCFICTRKILPKLSATFSSRVFFFVQSYYHLKNKRTAILHLICNVLFLPWIPLPESIKELDLVEIKIIVSEACSPLDGVRLATADGMRHTQQSPSSCQSINDAYLVSPEKLFAWTDRDGQVQAPRFWLANHDRYARCFDGVGSSTYAMAIKSSRS